MMDIIFKRPFGIGLLVSTLCLVVNICSISSLKTEGTYFHVVHYNNMDIFEDPEQSIQLQTELHHCAMDKNCHITKRKAQSNHTAKNSVKNHSPSLKDTSPDILEKVDMKLKEMNEESTADVLYDSCQDAYSKGNRKNGLYTIALNGTSSNLTVWCDMTTDNGGWVVFQRHFDDTVDFDRTWHEYKTGFGNLSGNFWLGLENIHKLAAPGMRAILRVDVEYAFNSVTLDYVNFHLYTPFSPKRFSRFDYFTIYGEKDGYRLKVDGHSGTAINTLEYSTRVECKFSTKDFDQDNEQDKNCAEIMEGGWWLQDCSMSNLNAKYGTHMKWDFDWLHGDTTSSEMKIKYGD